MNALAVPLLFVVGGLLAVQAAANVQLSKATRSPIAAATLQLAVAFVLLLVLSIFAGTVHAFTLIFDVTPWHLLGGLGSAVYITAGILLFPRLGALLTVGLFITGQMLASLVLDSGGVLGVRVDPLHIPEVVGVGAVLAGAALISRMEKPTVPTTAATAVAPALTTVPAHRDGHGHVTPSNATGIARVPSNEHPRRVGWLAVGLLGGAVLPVQAAVNAQLRNDLNAPLTVGAISFLLATATMALCLVATLILPRRPRSRPEFRPLRRVPRWAWLGGAIGATYVTAMFLLIPHIGAAPAVALTVAGQQLAGAPVDHYGLLRLPRRQVTRSRLIGVAVLLAGVALLQLG
jgi:bacterial/archaeal transporter family-2 protein